MNAPTSTPPAVPALLRSLQDALQLGDRPRAAQLAEQVLALQPDHEASLAWLADHARQQGDLARALHWIARGLQRLPGSALLHFHHGAVLDQQQRWPEARDALQAALACRPEDPFALFWLGQVQARLGAQDASLRTRVHALAVAERTGWMLNAHQLPPEARERIDSAIAAVAQARDAAVAQALAPLRSRQGGAALARIQRALDRHNGRARFEPEHPLQCPSFLFVPGLPAQAWFDRGEFPFLQRIEQGFLEIRAELLAVLADDQDLAPYVDMPEHAPAAPMWRTLNRSPRWTGYHLFRHGERVDAHCRRCPRTAALLESLPLMRIPGHSPEAMFSVLRPRTHIPPHTGVINGRLTVHLPLIVPEHCGALRAGDEMHPWQEGHCLVFDDSFVHEAWNDSDHTRVVLLFDIWNPHLDAVEREALTTAIAALGAFNARHGAPDSMHEAP
jgi:aspartate beta-hydroxylase